VTEELYETIDGEEYFLLVTEDNQLIVTEDEVDQLAIESLE